MHATSTPVFVKNSKISLSDAARIFQQKSSTANSRGREEQRERVKEKKKEKKVNYSEQKEEERQTAEGASAGTKTIGGEDKKKVVVNEVVSDSERKSRNLLSREREDDAFGQGKALKEEEEEQDEEGERGFLSRLPSSAEKQRKRGEKGNGEEGRGEGRRRRRRLSATSPPTAQPRGAVDLEDPSVVPSSLQRLLPSFSFSAFRPRILSSKTESPTSFSATGQSSERDEGGRIRSGPSSPPPTRPLKKKLIKNACLMDISFLMRGHIDLFDQGAAFSSFIRDMVSHPVVRLAFVDSRAQIDAYTRAIGHLSLQDVQLDQVLSLDGMSDMMDDVRVENFEVIGEVPGAWLISTRVVFPSATPTSVYLGDLGLELSFRNVFMGYVAASDVRITQGENRVVFVGRLEPPQNELDTVSAFFSSSLATSSEEREDGQEDDGEVDEEDTTGVVPSALATSRSRTAIREDVEGLPPGKQSSHTERRSVEGAVSSQLPQFSSFSADLQDPLFSFLVDEERKETMTGGKGATQRSKRQKEVSASSFPSHRRALQPSMQVTITSKATQALSDLLRNHPADQQSSSAFLPPPSSLGMQDTPPSLIPVPFSTPTAAPSDREAELLFSPEDFFSSSSFASSSPAPAPRHRHTPLKWIVDGLEGLVMTVPIPRVGSAADIVQHVNMNGLSMRLQELTANTSGGARGITEEGGGGGRDSTASLPTSEGHAGQPGPSSERAGDDADLFRLFSPSFSSSSSAAPLYRHDEADLLHASTSAPRDSWSSFPPGHGRDASLPHRVPMRGYIELFLRNPLGRHVALRMKQVVLDVTLRVDLPVEAQRVPTPGGFFQPVVSTPPSSSSSSLFSSKDRNVGGDQPQVFSEEEEEKTKKREKKTTERKNREPSMPARTRRVSVGKIITEIKNLRTEPVGDLFDVSLKRMKDVPPADRQHGEEEQERGGAVHDVDTGRFASRSSGDLSSSPSLLPSLHPSSPSSSASSSVLQPPTTPPSSTPSSSAHQVSSARAAVDDHRPVVADASILRLVVPIDVPLELEGDGSLFGEFVAMFMEKEKVSIVLSGSADCTIDTGFGVIDIRGVDVASTVDLDGLNHLQGSRVNFFQIIGVGPLSPHLQQVWEGDGEGERTPRRTTALAGDRRGEQGEQRDQEGRSQGYGMTDEEEEEGERRGRAERRTVQDGGASSRDDSDREKEELGAPPRIGRLSNMRGDLKHGEDKERADKRQRPDGEAEESGLLLAVAARMTNPSGASVDMGSVEVEVRHRGTVVGRMRGKNLFLQPGDNVVELLGKYTKRGRTGRPFCGDVHTDRLLGILSACVCLADSSVHSRRCRTDGGAGSFFFFSTCREGALAYFL